MTMNPVSALTGATTDRILDDELIRASCAAAMHEAAVIGARIGCDVQQSAEDRFAVTRKLGAFKTSMLQDVEAGRRSSWMRWWVRYAKLVCGSQLPRQRSIRSSASRAFMDACVACTRTAPVSFLQKGERLPKEPFATQHPELKTYFLVRLRLRPVIPSPLSPRPRSASVPGSGTDVALRAVVVAGVPAATLFATSVNRSWAVAVEFGRSSRNRPKHRGDCTQAGQPSNQRYLLHLKSS